MKHCIAALLLFAPLYPGSATAAVPPLEAAAVADLVDQFLPGRMATEGVPGAAVAVVYDGQLLFSRGYGLADVAAGRPVDPGTTLFRVASVSKLPAFAAVLQLAEQGKVDLHADVNRYLKGYQVQQRFGTPVTAHHLLTHTDGLAERNLGIFALSPAGLKPTATILGEMEPPFAPPGEMITYGSWGSALAGYLVEEVSGQRLAEYARTNLFEPLGMLSTTFEQALPADWQTRVAKVYTAGEKSSPYLYITTPATGGLTTTANDMAKFMNALLEGKGAYGAALESRYTPLPGFPGVTYGFMEHVENSRRLLVREGSGLGVGSLVALLPEERLGIFYVQNAKGTDLAMELVSAFLGRFYPDDGAPASVAPGTGDVGGVYRYVQHSRTTFTKLQALVAGMVRVRSLPGGSLEIGPVGMGDIYGGFDTVGRFEPVAPMVYRNPETGAQVGFRPGGNGGMQLVSGRGYHGTFARIPWYQTMAVQVGLLLTSAMLAVAAAFLARWGRWLAIGAAAANVGFLAALYPVLFVAGAAAGFPAYAFQGGVGWPAWLLLALPVVGACFALGLVGAAGLAWPRGRAGRGWLALAAGANVAFAATLWQWNLLGFHW